MKILAFGASNSSTSINKALATYAASLVKGATVEVLDLNDFEIPLFSEDREKEIGQPKLAKNFLAKIECADALIVSFAEHNGSYSAAYKNLFDWASRITRDVYQNKPVVYLATSPGPGGAQNVLKVATESARFFAADVKSSLSIPSFYDNFDSSTQQLTNETLRQALEDTVNTLLV